LKLGAQPGTGEGKRFKRVATGGTFDHIHAGHGAILERSFQIGDDVVIGLTSDEFVEKIGKRPDYPYRRREEELRRYIKEHYPGRSYHIAKLHDYFGPGIADPEIRALVASPETAARFDLANELRAEKGFPPLELVVVEWVNAEDGRPLSSSRIRSGEVDERGRVLRGARR
jgi:pantetheine-phosphate adenylyltransferase